MNIPTKNPNKQGQPADPLWQFLSECSLSEFTSDDIDDTLMTGLLFQTIRKLGIPPECLKKIDRTLVEFVNQKMTPFDPGKKEGSVVIHLFCQKRLIQPENVTESEGDLQAGQAIEPTPMIHSADPNGFGGWGFFIIERAPDLAASPAAGSPNTIDLFLYKEGD